MSGSTVCTAPQYCPVEDATAASKSQVSTHHNHAFLEWKPEAQVSVERFVPRRDALDGLVLHRLARAQAHATREDRLLDVARAQVERVRLLKNAEALEAAYECAVAEELDRVPVQAELQRFHGEL